MYPNFTLYPGGAFMLVESIGDIPYPGDDDIPSVDGEEMAAPAPAPVELRKMIAKDPVYIDPVTSTINKTRQMYEGQIRPILQLNANFTNSSDWIQFNEQLSNTISDVVRMIQIQGGKLNGIINTFMHQRVGETTFYANLGAFMRNRMKVSQNGMDTFEYTVDEIVEIADNWDMSRLLAVFRDDPELFDRVILGADFATMMGGRAAFPKRFDGVIDFLECVYNNQERLNSIEKTINHTLRFEDMLNSQISDYPEHDRGNPNHWINSVYSMLLRMSKMKLYDIECSIVDGKMTIEVYDALIQPIMMRIVNMFGLGMIFILGRSYLLREILAAENAAASYTESLLNLMKTH